MVSRFWIEWIVFLFEFAASIVEFDHGKLLKIIRISQFPLLNDSQKRRKDVFLLVSHDEEGKKWNKKVGL